MDSSKQTGKSQPNQSLGNKPGASYGAQHSDYFLSRWFFLRLLGIIYLFAFVSLWTQIEGLIGKDGILPATDMLEGVRRQTGADRYWYLPTLCWLSGSDSFLHFQCAAGTALSLLVIIGVLPGPALLGLWALYLSLATVGQDFLSFQWDILLLETGFLAIFFAPWQLRWKLAREKPPSLIMLWLLRWLLFRLMFMSGAVKLLSADATWWNLTALTMHYETQPLPTRFGWYAHQLPLWFQQSSCVIMFLIELVLPAFIFGGRRSRQFACAGFVFFMLLISITGNYCFFNLLTVALCALLLDDALLRRVFPGRTAVPPSARSSPTWVKILRWTGAGILVTITLLVSVTQTVTRLFEIELRKIPPPLLKLLQWESPLRTINSYGLFSVMTTTRPEIILEGSNDRVTWLPYEFKWKPGDPRRAPRWIAPHQPRLDWQMWFAALGNYQSNPWFVNFTIRLLQGKTEATALLEKNPFPDAPPRYIRSAVYEYHFTGFKDRRETGQWWRREYKGPYCPELSLRAGASR